MSVNLDRALRTCHWTVLAMIAVFAVVSAVQPEGSDTDTLDPTLTSVAIALGLATILTRRASTSPVISLRTRVTLLLCVYVCAFGLAALGSLVAMTLGQPQTGLAYALAAGILSLRAPPRFDSEPPRTS